MDKNLIVTLNETIPSMEVSQMVNKEHNKLMRDIRRYINQLGETKIGHTDFFQESTYLSEQNKELPCFNVNVIYILFSDRKSENNENE